MADELTISLLDKVIKSFNQRCKNHSLIQRVEKKVLDGTADLVDVQAYSGALGAQLANALIECIDFTELPDGKLYYELAKELLGEMLKTNYELVNAAAAEVTKALDAKVGFKLRSQKAKFPTDRVDTVAKSVCDPTVPQSTIERRLTSPVENISESFYTDFVKENADFRARSGVETYIVRKDGGKCCEWCAKLAGKYPYGEEPKDVYRRHDNCTCTVTFENGRQRQNVWTKATWTADEETLEQRKEFADKKPTVLTREQAKAREKAVEEKLTKRVDNYEKSGIIKEKENNSILIVSMQYFANKNIQKMSDNSLSKSINSWNERIKEHENKIANPENYYPEWNLFGERYKNGLIKHWEHEIKIFRKDIEEAQSELRKRGKNH